VLCTSSELTRVLPQLEEVLKRRVPIVTTTEEAAYPVPQNRRLVRRLDEAARKAKVAVIGTGVNPGFVMDALPIALTAVCERVDRIEVQRVQDARMRRRPFQRKIGAGLTPDAFQRGVEQGTLHHVGFSQSIQMIADAVGWKLERVTDDVTPKVASQAIESEFLRVDAGQVAGIIQDGVGYVGGERRITLHIEAYLGAPGNVRLGAHRGVAADSFADRRRRAR
jgi:4-hydroxy-tetrahydrodipicolinate reductase